ncbi:hypothetical protein [Christiangramia sabulilitoris]|uniref:Dihydroorotase n=1 Tax=Christiangramia sabulilitoris TaxID=2583991 RepID=A0A550I790_9FLAO|nr:hypothetical protein [Christiangramia sabulilitoris]TRO66678.1 hypothetical protein FGM01_01975 [Christiangramia sabulilitoris]
MKTILSLLFGFFISISAHAQEIPEVVVGETLEIGEAQQYGYAQIKLPPSNFILKQVGMLNFNDLKGTQVVVSKIKPSGNDEKTVILKRKDGKKFFGKFPFIKASYPKALVSGELNKV